MAVDLLLSLIAHLIGDYVIQSHWMATQKTSRWWPAIAHGITYGLPFLLVTTSSTALAIIVGTHIVIDRYRLARHVCHAKNALLSPQGFHPSWKRASATGYDPERTPPGMAVALMIVADNTIHIAINTAAITLT